MSLGNILCLRRETKWEMGGVKIRNILFFKRRRDEQYSNLDENFNFNFKIWIKFTLRVISIKENLRNFVNYFILKTIFHNMITNNIFFIKYYVFCVTINSNTTNTNWSTKCLGKLEKNSWRFNNKRTLLIVIQI